MGYLDYFRSRVISKVEGLPESALRESRLPTGWTPVELLKLVRPQLYVKGGDYDVESLEETRVVRGWGGDARALPFLEGYSTTALVGRIRG